MSSSPSSLSQITSPTSPFGSFNERSRFDSTSSSLTTDYYENSFFSLNNPNVQISGGAKKVNVEVIMKTNPFKIGKLLCFLSLQENSCLSSFINTNRGKRKNN